MSLVIRNIRGLWVIGYWQDTPYSYWGKRCWTPVSDHLSKSLAKNRLREIRKPNDKPQ